MNKIIMTFAFFIMLYVSLFTQAQTVDDYAIVLKKQGQEPVGFVHQQLQKHDLIIFDDALHFAKEPFDFYGDYIRQKPETIDYIFIEVFQTNIQKDLDAFLDSQELDSSLLYPVFQADYTYGWRYETYLELLTTVWKVNRQLLEEKRIRVIAVNPPIYWEAIHTRSDYEEFRKTLISRDHFMYSIVLDHMKNFEKGKKGFFLTNTRHAYKGIRKKDGTFFWNSGTFFHQWHSNKTYAIRFNNMNLHISKIKSATGKSMEGLDRLDYQWILMDEGKWDVAFEMNGSQPVAVPLEANVFGETPYVGNHMAVCEPNQTMYNAFDAVIFQKPIELTQKSGETGFFYTAAFKKEVERRVKILNEGNLEEFLRKQKCKTVSEFVDKLCQPQPAVKNPLIK